MNAHSTLPASAQDVTFTDLDLHGADLGEREFSACTFRGCKLSESKWARTRLEDCTFEGCDLTRADPSGMLLREVQFRRCKLMGIDWSHVGSFPAVAFEDCNLHYAVMVSIALRKTHFVRCSLLEAVLMKTDLVEAQFEDCQFTGARFEECDVRNATFAGARDLLLDPAKNKVKGARVPVESAVLLASSLGLQVLGVGQTKGRTRRSK